MKKLVITCIVLALIFLSCVIFLTRNKVYPDPYVPIEYNGKTFISMTTIPERLLNPWFEKNLEKTINMLDKNQILIINIPHISTKGEKYIIPESIKNMQGEKFIINRPKKDEGPITKLLPTLRKDTIKDTDVIIIIDDDIVYRRNVFNLLVNSVEKNPDKISTMCYKNIEGYKGFAFKKKVLKGILKMNIPKSCKRIDDDVIEYYTKKNNIGIVVVFYRKDNKWTCSMNKQDTGTHPDWAELINDNRVKIRKKCLQDLNQYS